MSVASGSRVAKTVLWLALAAGLFWATLRWPDAGSFWITAGSALFSLVAAVAIASGWRAGKWLGIAGGIVLILYALALVLLGTEDVGGLGLSLPWGIALAAFGVWNLFVEPGRESRVA